MSLYRQIVLVIILVFALMFAGTVIINVHNTRDYLATQLISHAQDTATSLGLSLSPQMANNDEPTMISMVDAIFDRGYYQDITLQRIEGDIIWRRQIEVTIEDIPRWLINWVELDAPEATAIIMNGWQQAGEVSVKSHPGYAYQTLWQTIVNMMWWFAGLTTILLALASIAVRMLLLPLERLEQQAIAVSERRFDEIKTIPRTRELRHVIQAMNFMTGKVKQMFEEQAESTERLRSIAFQDPLTGLQNRRYFDAALGDHLNDRTEKHNGALLLIQIPNLQAINQRLGFEAGDLLIKTAGEILQTCVSDINNKVLARLSGGDFAVMAEGISEEQASQLADNICRKLIRLQTEDLLDNDQVCHVGVTLYHSGMTYGDVLSLADSGLQTARSQGINTWAMHTSPMATAFTMPGRQEWQDIVREAVSSEQIILHAQAVADINNKNTLLHREVLLRLPAPNNELWTAGLFFPIAEQIGLASALDQIVIKQLLTNTALSAKGALAINISASALQQVEFIAWLENTLSNAGSPSSAITFELAESTVVGELEHVQQLANIVRQQGYGFAVDHFGRGMSTFGYLQSLRPDYVKIDGLYMKDIVSNKDDQFFVSSLCKVAHSLDITVIAESIESDEQIKILGELGVDGMQGYGVGRPAPL